MCRPNLFVPVIALLLAATLAAPASAAKIDRVVTGSWPAAELESLRFDLSVGELEVTATNGNTIEIEVVAECSDTRRECKEALEGLELAERSRGKRLLIEFDGYPKWGKNRIEVEAVVKIPADLEFELDMGVGEVDIEGLRGDLDLELGVGELTIVAQAKDLESVNLDVGVGEAELYGAGERVEERRSFLVGSEIYWAEGKGKSRIRVEVGVGEATVRLQ